MGTNWLGGVFRVSILRDYVSCGKDEVCLLRVEKVFRWGVVTV